MRRRNPGGLCRTRARTRQGLLFETGVPVTFRFMRNTAPSCFMGSRFGQDIEPTGTYMLLDDYDQWRDPPDKHVPGWVFGEKTFHNPLVIAMVADDNSNTSSYGPFGWKRRLSEHFGGKTGAALTRSILAVGFDGIVTVGPAPNDVREMVDLTAMPRSAEMRAKKNPLSPKAYAHERQPCALMRPYGIAPDDRSGVHFATNWGLAARYALFKASKSDSIGVVLEYDLAGLKLVPDHDATIEKEHGDYMVKEVNYYIDEFDILSDPDSPDYDRLADLMRGEQEMHESPPAFESYTIEGTLIDSSKVSIFSILADRLDDPTTQERALQAIQAADIPLEWWAESIAQVRTFAEVGEERLLRVMVLRPVEDELHDEYSDDDDEDACPAPLYIDDLDMIEDTLQRMSVTLWERPDARSVREVHYHGTDLTRAAFILQDSPAGAALHNPWHPCVQP